MINKVNMIFLLDNLQGLVSRSFCWMRKITNDPCLLYLYKFTGGYLLLLPRPV